MSNWSRVRPSISITLPPSMRIDGLGSLGLSMAMRPTSTHSPMNPSLWTGRFSRISNRLLLLACAIPSTPFGSVGP